MRRGPYAQSCARFPWPWLWRTPAYGMMCVVLPCQVFLAVSSYYCPPLNLSFSFIPVRNTSRRPSCRREPCVRVHGFAVTPASCLPVRGIEKKYWLQLQEKNGFKSVTCEPINYLYKWPPENWPIYCFGCRQTGSVSKFVFLLLFTAKCYYF